MNLAIGLLATCLLAFGVLHAPEWWAILSGICGGSLIGLLAARADEAE